MGEHGQEMALIGRDGRRYPLAGTRWRGDDGSPLMLTELPGMTRTDVDTAERSQWRFAAALPAPLADPRHRVTLGEGGTPLLARRIGAVDVRVKAEWINPSGSFKDRGAAVLISGLAGDGVTDVLADSSGNGGAALAAYAAAAGMRATILAPESTSPAKLLQARLYGARVELIPGSRQDTADAALRRAESSCYASHSWHPYFLQGVKLLAYEIWAELGFRAPDAVLMPAGGGSIVLGCSIGFAELLRAGAIEAVPRLLVAQPANCAPLAAAFTAGETAVRSADWAPTVAEGTAIARPVRDVEVLAAVRATGGRITAVTEGQIADGVAELARTGLYVEPTCATVVPALGRFAASGVIGSGDKVVVVLTGSGLKAQAAMAAIADQLK